MSPRLNTHTQMCTHANTLSYILPRAPPWLSSMNETTFPVYRPPASTHHWPLIALTALRALLLPNTRLHPEERPVTRGNVPPSIQSARLRSGLVRPRRAKRHGPTCASTFSLAVWKKNPLHFGLDLNNRKKTRIIFHFHQHLAAVEQMPHMLPQL